MDVQKGLVDCGVVHRHHLLPGLAVALLDGPLDLGDRRLERDDPGNLEEGGLHDHVDARAEPQLLGELDGVYRVDLELFVDDLLLHLDRHLVPHLVVGKRRAEEESAARFRLAEHVVLLQEGEVVAGDEVGVVDQVRRVDRLSAETQVRSGDGPRLLRVVDEVGLGVVVGRLANDLDGVLVRPHGAVRA